MSCRRPQNLPRCEKSLRSKRFSSLSLSKRLAVCWSLELRTHAFVCVSSLEDCQCVGSVTGCAFGTGGGGRFSSVAAETKYQVQHTYW